MFKIGNISILIANNQCSLGKFYTPKRLVASSGPERDLYHQKPSTECSKV